MRVLLPDPPPEMFAELLERRRRWDVDRFDEVWEGVLHVAPTLHRHHGRLVAQIIALLDPAAREQRLTSLGAFALGESDDHRVPDAGLARHEAGESCVTALVVEILSPGHETWDKLPFYGAHGVDEVLIVDPDERTVTWLALDAAGGEYRPVDRSALLPLGPAELSERLDWPA